LHGGSLSPAANETMNFKIRRRLIGAVLLALAIVSGFVVFAVTAETGVSQIVAQNDAGHFHDVVIVTPVTVHGPWLIPSFALLLAGIGFLVWPSRRPPRIIS
jgi:hypothetical protein